MASITTEPNGNRIVQVVCPDKKRRSIHLGKISKEDAEKTQTKVESLVASILSRTPPEPRTAEWLGNIPDALHKKLVKAGLTQPRHDATATAQSPDTLAQFVEQFITGRPDVKPGTVTNYRQAQAKLVAYFKPDTLLSSITALDSDRFRSWLKGDKKTKRGRGLSENSARSIVKNAKLIFGAAVKGRLIAENPFVGHSTAIIERPDRLEFVKRETINRVLASCPNAEWRAIVSLCRFGGLRCPSEVLTLRWSDIDFDRGRMLIRSPKLEGQQGEFREMPLFPEVRTALEELMIEPDGAEFVISNQRQGTATNLRTTFEKIVTKAKVKPWKKPFQNLRSSRQTELAESFPIHVVTKWLGNSLKVAEKHYLQVRDEEYAKAVQIPVQQSLADSGNGSQPLANENEKPLVLQGKPTKQGVFRTRLVPPAGFEPAYQD